ncbi:MAG: alpha/beta hydrolase family protein [Nocardioidaceae bacterium]
MRAPQFMALFVLIGVLTACTSAPAEEQSAPRATPPPTTTSTAPDSPSPTNTSPTRTAKPPHPVSLPALMRKEYDGRGLRVGRVLARTDAYTRYFATYKSGRLTISGILNLPQGNGPFPVVVLNHGYIDPAIYNNGQGLMREQDYLAREGYVVLHTDYRSHAQSSPDRSAEQRLRLGYTEDVINAVLAVKASTNPKIDGERVALLGRSMGGGVTLNALAVQPGLVDAAVVFASVSSDTVDNFNRWTRPERAGAARQIIAAYGSPEANPWFWRHVSPRTYFDRVTEPVLMHHGTADDSCPIAWSRTTLSALTSAGVDARLHVYDGEAHAFGPQWPRSMRRTVDFLDQHLA